MRSPFQKTIILMSASGEINQDAADRLMDAWEEEREMRFPREAQQPKWWKFSGRCFSDQRDS